MVKTQRSTRFS